MNLNKLVETLKYDIALKNPVRAAASKADESLREIIRTIRHYNFENRRFEDVEVKVIPGAKAVLYKRIKQTGAKAEKVPVKTKLAVSQDNYRTFYHFLEPDTNIEIGFVAIADWNKAKHSIAYKMGMFDEALLKDYPRLGITGSRVSIDYVKNNLEDLYSGAGSLADRLAVEYCLKHNIKPNVTLTASENAHSAHFKRGYRFFPVKNESGAVFDADKIVASRIKYTKPDERVNTENMGNLHMYMPLDVVKKHLSQIYMSPVLP